MSFAVGQRVRISGRPHDGHHRTPTYVKGRTGTVVRCQGSYTNPETRAYGTDGLPKRELYLVALTSETNETMLVDVYEHWLEAET